MGRLFAGQTSPFAGKLISRTREINFSLDGRNYSALEGDTVLSALLANGVDTVGSIERSIVGLSLDCTPLIKDLEVPDLAPIPLAQLPVRAGARYETLGRPGGGFFRNLKNLGSSQRRSLDLDCARIENFPPAPWPQQLNEHSEFDCVVVGGGVAGMAACLAAAGRGDRVALIEQTGMLGGDAILHGNRAGEPEPSEQVSKLAQALAAQPAIKVHFYARALAAEETSIIVQFGTDLPRGCRSGIARLRFKRLVLATGCAERLPIFAGNRLAGVEGISGAFHLAHAYGVWPGERAIVFGGTNLIYRLGMLARDAEIEIEKLCDPRTDPNSRFRDFSKAYGLRTNAGTRVRSAHMEGETLQVALAPTHGDGAGASETVPVDRLIASDGWVARLGLWREAGGQCAFDAEARRLIAGDGPAHVALAGSAAGYGRTIACAQSGEHAIARIWGEQLGPIADEALPEAYETPDLSLGVPERLQAQPPAYLGRGCRFVRLKPSHETTASEAGSLRDQGLKLAGEDGTLELEDVDVLARLGVIPPHLVDPIARERHLPPRTLRAGPPLAVEDELGATNDTPKLALPPFLGGRFGSDAHPCFVQLEGRGEPECGALIYPDSDQHGPMSAIGVVLWPVENGAYVLLASPWIKDGLHVVVRSLHGPVAAAIIVRDPEPV